MHLQYNNAVHPKKYESQGKSPIGSILTHIWYTNTRGYGVWFSMVYQITTIPMINQNLSLTNENLELTVHYLFRECNKQVIFAIERRLGHNC